MSGKKKITSCDHLMGGATKGSSKYTCCHLRRNLGKKEKKCKKKKIFFTKDLGKKDVNVILVHTLVFSRKHAPSDTDLRTGLVLGSAHLTSHCKASKQKEIINLVKLAKLDNRQMCDDSQQANFN